MRTLKLEIELTQHESKHLSEIASTIKISEELILKTFLKENFFPKAIQEKEVSKFDTFQKQAKELGIKQREIAEYFGVATPTVNKAINQTQKNVVSQAILSADTEELINEIYQSINKSK